MNRVKGYFYTKFVKPIFTINDTPHSIALGVALGMFVALTPTVGLQMLIILVIGTLIKANRIIGVLLVWISNPITMGPMYYSYYWLGGKILGVELWTFNTFTSKYNTVMEVGRDSGIFGVIKQLSVEIGPSLFLGSLIVATICSVPLYPWVLYVLHRKRKSGNGDTPEEGNPVQAGAQLREPEKENPDVFSTEDKKGPAYSASCCGKVTEPVSKSNSSAAASG